MKTRYFKHLILGGFLAFSFGQLAAQQDTTLNKEVEVVKAYQPSISDAHKINDMPAIGQSSATKPVFDYQIKTRPMITNFSMEPVQAARMANERGTPLEKGFIRAGLGNYTTQYGEFFYNTEAGRSSTVGVHLKTHLSNGQVKLANDDKVKAPDNESLIKLFTSHKLNSGTLSTDFFFEQKSFRYYGYTGLGLTDTEKEQYLSRWNEKQAFPKAGFYLHYDKKYDPRASIQYNTGLGYRYFGTKTGQQEHLVNWDGHFSTPINLMEGVLDAGITYSTIDSVAVNTITGYGERTQLMLKFNPSAVFDSPELKFRIGMNSYTTFKKDEDTDYFISPNLSIEYQAIEDGLTLFAGTKGYVEQNNYSFIAEDNPFVRPDQNAKSTKYRYILSGGFRANASPNLSFGAKVEYASIKDQQFYYLNNTEVVVDTLSTMYQDNTFDLAYDKVKQFSLKGELQYALNQELNIRLEAAYHSYSLDSLQEAFLKPNFEATASFYYDPEGPIRFTADLYYVGQRKALIRTQYDFPELATNFVAQSDDIYDMSGFIDLNLGIEYQLTGQLSLWGQANNFAFQKYELFPGYRKQSFNLLVGASFSF